MAKWKYSLKFTDEWKACSDGKLALKELITIVVKKLKGLNIQGDYEFDDIIEEFIFLNEDDNPNVNEFDYIWNRLYDWGDQITSPGHWPQHKMCWIGTF